MSACDSAGFDGSAESMALLGQHERIPDPTAADAATALAHKSGPVSERLKVVLSQCQTDSEIDREMWDDFEVHRRSADTYMSKYLDCLQQVHEERPGRVSEIDDFGDEVPPTGTDTENTHRKGVLICCDYRRCCATTGLECNRHDEEGLAAQDLARQSCP
jgi:hypothetical protein